MAKDTIRVGIVGVGGMGSKHCQTCGSIDEVELAAVADRDAQRAREIGESFGVPWFSDHTELLKQTDLDGVIIATPHYYHPPIAVDAFRAGKHVLSEKPIGVQVGYAEQMAQAAKQHEKIFCVMFQRRCEPAIRTARELVERGELGEIHRTLLISPEYRSQAYYDSGGWRATWAGEGGGPMMNQAPHIMDIFVLLGGMPARVTGKTRTVMHNIEVEDEAEAVLEYKNGGTGYFYVSTCEPKPGQVIQIFGDKGKLQFIDGRLFFTRYHDGVREFTATAEQMWGKPESEDVELQLPQAETGHGAIIRNFARAILYGEELIAPGEDGTRSLELANAIMLSSYENHPVDIPIDRERFNQLMERLCAGSSYDDGAAGTDTARVTDPQFEQ